MYNVYMKIYITGGAGSGKTTYAKKLSAELGVKLYSTDDFYNIEKKRMFNLKEIKDLIPINSDWIIEGAYYIPEYIEAADKVIYFRISVMKTVYRIMNRWFKSKDLRKKFSFFETLRLVYTTIRDMYISDGVNMNTPKQRHYREKDRYLLCKENAKVLEIV